MTKQMIKQGEPNPKKPEEEVKLDIIMDGWEAIHFLRTLEQDENRIGRIKIYIQFRSLKEDGLYFLNSISGLSSAIKEKVKFNLIRGKPSNPELDWKYKPIYSRLAQNREWFISLKTMEGIFRRGQDKRKGQMTSLGIRLSASSQDTPALGPHCP